MKTQTLFSKDILFRIFSGVCLKTTPICFLLVCAMHTVTVILKFLEMWKTASFGIIKEKRKKIHVWHGMKWRVFIFAAINLLYENMICFATCKVQTTRKHYRKGRIMEFLKVRCGFIKMKWHQNSQINIYIYSGRLRNTRNGRRNNVSNVIFPRLPTHTPN